MDLQVDAGGPAVLPEFDSPIELETELGCVGPIRSVMLCKFDVVQGPVIIFQTPHDVITDGVFKNLEKYIIVKPELAGR